VKVYVVDAVSPVAVKVGVVVVPATIPVVALVILYPATPTLSVEAVHFSEIVLPVVPVTTRAVGVVGGVVSGVASVVKVTPVLAAETWPAESFARTESVNAVAGVSPLATKLVVVDVPITVVPLRMSYPVIVAELSVDAVQFNVADVVVITLAARFVGTLGPVPPARPQ
jgi:hypothetical protein